MPARSPRRAGGGGGGGGGEQDFAQGTGLAKRRLLKPLKEPPYSFEVSGGGPQHLTLRSSPPWAAVPTSGWKPALPPPCAIACSAPAAAPHRPHSHACAPTCLAQSVPRAAKDLSGSGIQRITSRQAALDMLAEMLLLCNEAARRSTRSTAPGTGHAKPLALEYLADRLDTDDPLHGYVVRTREEVRTVPVPVPGRVPVAHDDDGDDDDDDDDNNNNNNKTAISV
jgi:hypothetical protein